MASKTHEPHPDCPDTLSCLPDTDGRPQHTLPVILRCAILGSARKRLTIREIYASMEEKYPYYKTAGPTWKQSVRHHLSLNRLFERQPRPVADPGFGSYWTVNLTAPPGTKRPRKRGRPNKDRQDEAGPPAKRRGRPRKTIQNHDDAQSSMTASASSGGQTWPSQEMENDDDDGEIVSQDERDEDDHVSEEEEYESEEDMIYPFENDISRSKFGPRASSSQFRRATAKIRIPPYGEDDRYNHIIDHLKIEMAGLRRQSAEALSVSLRMSDQLAEAQATASRAQAALRTAERMLEDEARKRREAEREADGEARKRRVAEEELQTLRRQQSCPSLA